MTFQTINIATFEFAFERTQKSDLHYINVKTRTVEAEFCYLTALIAYVKCSTMSTTMSLYYAVKCCLHIGCLSVHGLLTFT